MDRRFNTLIKLIVKSLIEEGACKMDVFYATCDVMINHIELPDEISSIEM